MGRGGIAADPGQSGMQSKPWERGRFHVGHRLSAREDTGRGRLEQSQPAALHISPADEKRNGIVSGKQPLGRKSHNIPGRVRTAPSAGSFEPSALVSQVGVSATAILCLRAEAVPSGPGGEQADVRRRRAGERKRGSEGCAVSRLGPPAPAWPPQWQGCRPTASRARPGPAPARPTPPRPRKDRWDGSWACRSRPGTPQAWAVRRA